jgi:hypothetical protein
MGRSRETYSRIDLHCILDIDSLKERQLKEEKHAAKEIEKKAEGIAMDLLKKVKKDVKVSVLRCDELLGETYSRIGLLPKGNLQSY